MYGFGLYQLAWVAEYLNQGRYGLHSADVAKDLYDVDPHRDAGCFWIQKAAQVGYAGWSDRNKYTLDGFWRVFRQFLQQLHQGANGLASQFGECLFGHRIVLSQTR